MLDGRLTIDAPRQGVGADGDDGLGHLVVSASLNSSV
jgi:hypothetical protein